MSRGDVLPCPPPNCLVRGGREDPTTGSSRVGPVLVRGLGLLVGVLACFRGVRVCLAGVWGCVAVVTGVWRPRRSVLDAVDWTGWVPVKDER